MDNIERPDPGRNLVGRSGVDGPPGARVSRAAVAGPPGAGVSGVAVDGASSARVSGEAVDGASGARVSGVGVLDRSMSLLELLADGPRTLRSLAQASGLPRPTAHRLLVALEVHGLAGRTEDGAFRLGPRLTELALRAGDGLDLGRVAGGVLGRLHDQTGESVQLYVRSGDRRLCVAARDAGAGLRDSVPVGAVLPLDAGSGGKVLLAWSDDADRFPAADAGELAAVRRRGWAASVAEREPGVASVSAPVLRDGQLLGAVCVSGPASRLGPAPGRRLAPLVVAAGQDLAALAGPAVAAG